jgi:hypothetical protein
MATPIVWTFLAGNLLTLIALAGLYWLDQSNIRGKLVPPADASSTTRL